MPRKSNKKHVLTACEMSFEGFSNRAIADKLETTESTISRWRRLDIWQEYEAELIAAHKREALQAGIATPL